MQSNSGNFFILIEDYYLQAEYLALVICMYLYMYMYLYVCLWSPFISD